MNSILSRSFARATLRLSGVALLTVAAALPAVAADCQNVQFSFINQVPSNNAIQVQRVRYFSATDGTWRDVNVTDVACNPGDTCTTSGNDLDRTEGDDITLIRFYTARLRASGWSAPRWGTPFATFDPLCVADRTYGAFTIN